MNKLISGIAVAGAMLAGAHAEAQDKPTIVLVHGAFADSSSWNGVIEILEKDGFPIVAAANPLRGVSSDAAYVADILASIATPVVLVGHSYGGSVISQAAPARTTSGPWSTSAPSLRRPARPRWPLREVPGQHARPDPGSGGTAVRRRLRSLHPAG